MKIKPLTPAIGAEIQQVNLNESLSEDQLNEIHSTLVNHKMLLFPGQDLTAESQLRFAETFGNLDKPYAIADYMPQYRRMHRVTVIDDRRVR